MKPLMLLLLALLQFSAGAIAQHKVESVGITPAVKLEEVISGHLTELNGKFKLRVTELTFAPGASLGVHHHAGPGVRLVLSGELSFVQAGKTTIYRAGDYFYESGNVVHTASNASKAPVRVAFFEVLAVQWSGPSVTPPRAY
jgi:quercetin dioxygenase-like cupin family protein